MGTAMVSVFMLCFGVGWKGTCASEKYFSVGICLYLKTHARRWITAAHAYGSDLREEATQAGFVISIVLKVHGDNCHVFKIDYCVCVEVC